MSTRAEPGESTPSSPRSVRLALLGDVMLGRSVDQYVSTRDPAYVWGDAISELRRADVLMVNLECVIAAEGTGRPWPGKTFHFKAGPWAIEALHAAGVDAVALANNHVLDYQASAFLEMLGRLESAGIPYTGAARSLEAASEPVLLEANGIRMALLAATDNEPEWEARPLDPDDPSQSSGVFFVPLDAGGDRFRRLASAIEAAKARAEVVIVSAHVGPHMREWPGEAYVKFARAVIDAGASVYMGSSNHIFQGVEQYGDGLILYDLGDAIDDYVVDMTLRNDRSFVFLVEFEGSRLRSLELHPTEIVQNRMILAREQARQWSLARMLRLSRELGTQLIQTNGKLVLAD